MTLRRKQIKQRRAPAVQGRLDVHRGAEHDDCADTQRCACACELCMAAWSAAGEPDPPKAAERFRRSERVRNAAFLSFVHTLPCAAIGMPGHTCDGPLEADHQGRRPAGRKADDDTSVPLCKLGHQQRDAFKGAWLDYDHDRMRAWLDDKIAATRAAWIQHLAATTGCRIIPF